MCFTYLQIDFTPCKTWVYPLIKIIYFIKIASSKESCVSFGQQLILQSFQFDLIIQTNCVFLKEHPKWMTTQSSRKCRTSTRGVWKRPPLVRETLSQHRMVSQTGILHLASTCSPCSNIHEPCSHTPFVLIAIRKQTTDCKSRYVIYIALGQNERKWWKWMFVLASPVA